MPSHPFLLMTLKQYILQLPLAGSWGASQALLFWVPI